MVRSKTALIALTSLFIHSAGSAQNTNSLGEIHGNFEVNAQYYNEDTVIGTKEAPEKMLSNAYANFLYTRGNLTAGFRFESYLNPLQSIDSKYKGTGIPYRFVTYTVEDLEVTAGNFYEQFGSGF